jgi:thermostable 8-oxoguanine DNA glycosylase
MQSVRAWVDGGSILERQFPGAKATVPNHKFAWGFVEEIGSPAYWAAQAWMWEVTEPNHYRLGRTLREEVLACLLGGYGIPAEVGLAAYERLRAQPAHQLLDEAECLELLHRPLEINGRLIRYRFANQKARYVAAALTCLERIPDDLEDIELRNALAGLPGIGLKTASWIVRNWRASDAVSILDIHIVRASEALGLFEAGWKVSRHYRAMEKAYLRFCRSIGARASILDSVMWMTMRQLPDPIIRQLIPRKPSKASDPSRKQVDARQMQLL